MEPIVNKTSVSSPISISRYSNVSTKMPRWARAVDSHLFWEVNGTIGDYSPDDIVDLLVFYGGTKKPLNAPPESKWHRLNSTSWGVRTPLRLVPILAQLPGVCKITR